MHEKNSRTIVHYSAPSIATFIFEYVSAFDAYGGFCYLELYKKYVVDCVLEKSPLNLQKRV